MGYGNDNETHARRDEKRGMKITMWGKRRLEVVQLPEVAAADH